MKVSGRRFKGKFQDNLLRRMEKIALDTLSNPTEAGRFVSKPIWDELPSFPPLGSDTVMVFPFTNQELARPMS